MNTQKWAIQYICYLTLMLTLFSSGIGIAAADPVVDYAVVAIDDASAAQSATTTTPITITGLSQQLGAATVILAYDADVEVVDVKPGTMGTATVGIDNTMRTTTITWFDASGIGVTGDQTFATVELKAIGSPGETSPLGITVTTFTGADTNPLPFTDDDGLFTIEGVPSRKVTATRDIFNQRVKPGSTFQVTLTLTANADVQAPGLEENLPTGCGVTPVDNGGALYNSATTQWAWVSRMSSGETKIVTYNVAVPTDAVSQDYYIAGHVSAYGVDPLEIGGERRVTVVTLCGDVNHDELLLTTDVLLALQMAANNTNIDFAADVNADGVVTAVDALSIWQSMLS